MSTTFYDVLGNAVAATITLASLASSATAGRQATAIDFSGGTANVPDAIDVEFFCKLATGAPANDSAVYLWIAQSNDGTNYEVGSPAVDASDAAFTFTNSPAGTTPSPTPFRYIGALQFASSGQPTLRRIFTLSPVPKKGVFVVLNYSGQALTSTGTDHGINYYTRQGLAQ